MKGIILAVFWSLCAAVSARTYYVAPTGGSDTYPGTITQPWSTWQKAFNAAQAGDTVYFRGGTWYPTVTVRHNPNDGNGHNGTHDDPICFFNYPGEIPILDCINFPKSILSVSGIDIYRSTNLKFKGLKLKNVRQTTDGQYVSAFAISANGNFSLENMESSYNGGSGFWFTGTDTLYLINCDSHNNVDTTAAPGLQVGGKSDGFNIIGGGALTDTFKIAHIYGCRSWNNSDDAFDISSSKQYDIHDNWAWNNGKLDGGGNVFKFANSTLLVPSKRKVYNNLSAYNRDASFANLNLSEVENPIINEFYNNTSYYDWIGFYSIIGDWVASLYQGSAIYRNNISYGYTCGMPAAFKAGNDPQGTPHYVTQDHNTWIQKETIGWYTESNPIYTITDADFISLDTAQLRYPRKADGSLPDITFLKLKEGSDLIDTGIDIGLPYYGAAPDLGYSEFLSGSAIIPTPIYLKSVIESATPSRLEMTYNLALASFIPAASAFIVKVNSVTQTVSSVAISGAKVLLTLTSPVVYGDLVTVAYTKPSTNPLQTASGGQATSITAQNVTNNCTVPAANQPPTVNISSPTKSTSFRAPATITIDAVASDPDGTISKVEFYQSTVKLGERTTTPYSFTWKEVPEGNYSLTAIATDNKTSKTTSAAVTVVVEKSATATNQLPIVSVTSPSKGKKNKKHDNIVIEVNASDSDGTISNVEIKSGSITLTKLTISPYVYIWEDVDTGTYMITAIATDNLGATTESSVMEICVETYEANSGFINLYPNPNNGHFSVDFFTSHPDQQNRITIVSFSGKMVFNDIIAQEESSRDFDLSDKAPGTYVLMLMSKDAIVTAKKFFKK